MRGIATASLDDAAALIRKADKILLSTHEKADGDGLGSQIALALGLEALGKRVLIRNGETIPRDFEFLDSGRRVQPYDPEAEPGLLQGIELFIVLDNASWARLGRLGEAIRSGSAPALCLDHHLFDEPFSEHHVCIPEAAATGEIVMDLLERLEQSLNLEMAQAIYTSICCDTGWFRFGNTRPETMRKAAKLLDCGVRPETVSEALAPRDSLEQKLELARAMERIRVERDGRFAWSKIFANEPRISSDALLYQLRTLDGADLVCVAREMQERVKFSFRSKGACAAREVALALGGGGHQHAAGASVQEPLEVAIKMMRRAAARHLDEVARG